MQIPVLSLRTYLCGKSSTMKKKKKNTHNEKADMLVQVCGNSKMCVA